MIPLLLIHDLAVDVSTGEWKERNSRGRENPNEEISDEEPILGMNVVIWQ